MESKLINVKAAARLLNRHPSTVSNMMKKGELPHVTLHGRRYIDQAVIERLLAQDRLGLLQAVPPHDLLQQRPALLQRQGPHVLTVHDQHVEGDVDRLPAAEQQVVEPRPSPSSATISPSKTYPGGRASSSPSNRLSGLPFFDSIRPWMLSASPRKSSSFSSNR